ncbi:MAG: autotransporter-associated beta strand repeat-containing protein [Kiritimatiellae bacterium]|nr:autotransporter-associated beta strand repeat-containing protein [Kiritimatiellia bacterium]
MKKRGSLLSRLNAVLVQGGVFTLVLGFSVSLRAETLTWTGNGANKKWSTTGNWDPAQAMTASDTAQFQTGTLSSDTIIYDTGNFANIAVPSGAWTVNVSSATFTYKPITVASGAKFALSGAGSRTNPFSTNQNANAVAGLLDLGGAKQTIADTMGNDVGFFRNGGEIRNGLVTNTLATTAYFPNTTFTVGPGANLYGAIRVRFRNGAKLVVDGGTFRTTHVTSSNNNHPIGEKLNNVVGNVDVVAQNGGKFIVTAAPVWVGFTSHATMVGDHGMIDLGGQNILFSIYNNIQSVLVLTNSTFTCGVVQFGYDTGSSYASPGKQTLILKDSVANVTRFSGVVMNPSSSILFDGATLVPKSARTDFLPASNKIPTPTIGAGGLVVSNNYDVAIAKGMAGTGRFVKAGKSTLTLSGVNTFTGGIEVRTGTLAIDAGASFANSTLAMADGTKLKVKYLPGYEFATTNLTLALDANTDGKVTIEFDLTDGFPEEGRTYRLLAPGLDAATLNNRISVVPDKAFTFAFAQDGALTVTLEHTPTTRVWTGGGADEKWTTTDNWDVNRALGPLDRVVFGGTDSHSVFDGTDGLPFWDITVNSGCHTANVATASFANAPLVVTNGAAFVLENAEGVTNPFSTVANENAVGGLLDLGGATQTITTTTAGNDTGFFRDGCEIRNGTLTVNPTSDALFKNTSFTVGTGATVVGPLRLSLDNASIVVDAGTLNTTYADPDFGNNPIGRNHEGIIVLRNGGRFLATSEIWLGFNANATMVGEDAVIDVGDNAFYMSIYNGSVLALTNSTLTCGRFLFGYSSGTAVGVQTVSLKDTVLNLSKFVGQRTNAASSFLLDGVTLVPKAAATDFIPGNANMPMPTIGAGGLTITNEYDITIAKGMAGVGGLVKEGIGALTLAGPSTFTGGIDVRKGTLALNPGASFPDAARIAMADGTTLRLGFSPEGGFASTNIALVLDANTDGKVSITFDVSAGYPEPNRPYTLFSSGLDAATLSRLEIDPACTVGFVEGGALTVTFNPKTHVWTGAGADAKWTTAGNWNINDPVFVCDHVIFSVGGYSIFDCANGLRLGSITAGFGCHTANVETACFDNVPITVANGAAFVLENANCVTNPFSTAVNTNVISGVLDLGGAVQTFAVTQAGNGTESFRDGGEIRNGTVKISGSDEQRLNGTAFTFGKGSLVSYASRIYLQYGAHLTIDGGTYTNTFAGNNHVLGANDGVSSLEVLNGGRFVAKREWFVGHTSSGSLIGDGGIIDVGNYPLYLSNNSKAVSVLALTNSVLTCSAIQFAYGSSNYSTQTLVLKNTVVYLSNFIYKNKKADSSILFDGATLVPKAEAVNFMPSGLPSPTLGANGLVISNAFDVTADVGMKGTGGLVKMGGGKLTLTGNQSFSGDVVVSNGTFTSSSTFAGGLRVASGSTIDVPNATFGGNIAFEAGVVLPATNGVDWTTNRFVPIAKTTANVSYPSGSDADGRHFFVRVQGGLHTLCYGRKGGLVLSVR